MFWWMWCENDKKNVIVSQTWNKYNTSQWKCKKKYLKQILTLGSWGEESIISGSLSIPESRSSDDRGTEEPLGGCTTVCWKTILGSMTGGAFNKGGATGW